LFDHELNKMAIPDPPNEYKKGCLTRNELDPDPLVQFDRWYMQARNSSTPYAHAMSLATASKEGMPSIRTVFLKQADRAGFVFFTNYQSPKARDIERRPEVALLFLWKAMERQVTISGRAVKIPSADSADYFSTRCRGSQLGALISPQSQVVPSRDYLDKKFRVTDEAYSNKPIERPEHWGGYCVKPRTIEFWQGRPSRLNDRFLYSANEDQSWTIQRLAP
jgi:pyridoxamine 5'-phosphate oxidase